MDLSPAGAEVVLAVERLAAARVSRALPLLGLLGIYGAIRAVRSGLESPDPLVLIVGAVLSAASMAAYGKEAVRRVMEVPSPWTVLIHLGSFIPYLFGGYVVISRVLRLTYAAEPMRVGGVILAVAAMLAGVLCMRAQWRLTEVNVLAREMSGLANV